MGLKSFKTALEQAGIGATGLNFVHMGEALDRRIGHLCHSRASRLWVEGSNHPMFKMAVFDIARECARTSEMFITLANVRVAMPFNMLPNAYIF